MTPAGDAAKGSFSRCIAVMVIYCAYLTTYRLFDFAIPSPVACHRFIMLYVLLTTITSYFVPAWGEHYSRSGIGMLSTAEMYN